MRKPTSAVTAPHQPLTASRPAPRSTTRSSQTEAGARCPWTRVQSGHRFSPDTGSSPRLSAEPSGPFGRGSCTQGEGRHRLPGDSHAQDLNGDQFCNVIGVLFIESRSKSAPWLASTVTTLGSVGPSAMLARGRLATGRAPHWALDPWGH